MIEVIKAGVFSSIQDQGRFGHRHIGVPLSGAMDARSANLANSLLDNTLNCAVLETTLLGPTLKFNLDTFVAVTGANCELLLNKKPIGLNTVIDIKKGDLLTVGKVVKGVRSYLAVSGGFRTEKILGSRSYYSSVTNLSRIHNGDILNIVQPKKDILNRSTIGVNSTLFNQNLLSASKGPEFNLLDNQTQLSLFKLAFKILPQSNRMAYKFNHAGILKTQEIITSSVQPGTVQLTPSGELIILMRDCQTTGGYARVLQLNNSTINQISQMQANEKISFIL